HTQVICAQLWKPRATAMQPNPSALLNSVAARDGAAIIGTYTGTLDFGTDVLTTKSSDGEVFLARVDAACKVRWAKRFTGSADGSALAIDSDGNLIIGGGGGTPHEHGGGRAGDQRGVHQICLGQKLGDGHNKIGT